MSSLIAGVLLWSLLHFLPAGAVGLRTSLVSRMGETPYKGAFAVLMLVAVALMVTGWKATTGEAFYAAPDWGGALAFVLVLAAALMLFAPYVTSNLSRVVRHPQLTGVALFGVGHLSATGNLRAIVLFGGLALWAVIEIVLLNRRDGAWQKPEPVPRLADFKLLLVGLGFFLITLFTHEGLFGVSPLPG